MVDPAMPAQPLAVLEAELGSFERPLLARRVAEHVVGVGVGGGWVSEDAVGPGEQLAQPGRWPRSDRRVQFGDLLEDLTSLLAAVGPCRGEREVPGCQVGHVLVVGSPVGPEQLAQLLEGGEVVVVRDGAQAEGVAGARGDHPALFGVGGERGKDEIAGMGRVAAGGLDRRGDEDAGRLGDVSRRVVARLCDQFQCVIPAPGVEVGPAERGQRSAACGADGGIGGCVPCGV